MRQTEKHVWVWADTANRGTCNKDGCGAQITWAERVDNGRRDRFGGGAVALRTTYLNDDHEAVSPLDGGRMAWQFDTQDEHWRWCVNWRRRT